ncbi:MAG: helicase C-terminal domain-containing protein [Candidatus Uhrbacteria bacterium]|nr:helicase C-terminal domain-containing protein [Candidatus Uhrbacteria bacterium]
MSKLIPLDRLRRAFPFPEVRPNQAAALEAIAGSDDGVLLEMPTGDGKTAVGMAALLALADHEGPRFYVTPTRALVAQLQEAFPCQVTTVFGRSEYRCLYYVDRGVEDVNAADSPCYMLQCGHRVDQETGETEEAGAEPCPYFQAKYQAMQQTSGGQVVACTTAFFLMNRMLVTRWREQNPALVVVDEAHRLAQVARGIFEYTLTDFHLLRAARLLKDLARAQANIMVRFVKAFRRMARRRPARHQSLFTVTEVESLIAILDEMDRRALERAVVEAVRSGRLDPIENKGDLKVLENLTRNIPRILTSLRYATVGEDERQPLKYVVAYYLKQDDPEFVAGRKRARYHLRIRTYFVAPIIRRALGPNVVAYSATIGNSEVFGWETGIRHPFRTFESPFSTLQTRIFVPRDARDLSFDERRHRNVNWTLRQIVNMAKRFARAGHRSLIVLVSDAERQQFLRFAGEESLEALSYGFGADAKQVAAHFLEGRGEALVGTAAQYGEGIDLPRQAAPVIFFLRPGYPHPQDPEAQFEEARFPASQVWALRRYRVLMQALQVRGRNIRSSEDVGVCFFMSSQFAKFLFAGLPKWLQSAYRDKLDMEGAVKDTLALLHK